MSEYALPQQMRERIAQFTDAQLLQLSPLARSERRAAEASLHTFVRQAWPIVEGDRPFVDNWHVQSICEHLEAVTAGRITRLLVNVPPGCMKSLLMGVFWPCWVWACNPESRWFFASYSQALSTRDSVKSRTLLGSDWYRRHWGHTVQLASDQNQKTYFETTAGGWRLATSVGGRGTGEHPDYIVVDDPHNVVQAESQTQREGVLDWWDGTMSTRGRSRGVRQVVIMQRLHEDDLSGHILSQQTGWDHLCFPMRYEGPDRMRPTAIGGTDPRTAAGELLWPSLFPEEMVSQLERDLGSRRAAGQLQQRPAPEGGELFKRDWFHIVSTVPPQGRGIRYWDLASSEDQGDYTVGVLLVERQDAFYILDVVRGRWSVHNRNQILLQTAQRDAQRRLDHVEIWIEQEPGASGVAAAQYLIRLLAGHTVKAEKVDRAKELRWEPWSAQLEAGNVFLLKADWNSRFIDEHLIAPNGVHDDQLDAASGAFNVSCVHGPWMDLKAWLDAGAL